jgi:ribonuclease HII
LSPLKKFDAYFFSSGFTKLAGVDEAGRGPLAGPVVSAAVIFENETYIEGINDSKKLNESTRERLAEIIKEKAICFSYGVVDQNTIDEINILRATLKSMKNAVDKLSLEPDMILIDGNKSFPSGIPTQTIVKGDGKSFSIAAASILAKVERDKIMKRAAENYPQYLWQNNKGYGTKQHIHAIKKYGHTEFHRKSFLTKILNFEIQDELI